MSIWNIFCLFLKGFSLASFSYFMDKNIALHLLIFDFIHLKNSTENSTSLNSNTWLCNLHLQTFVKEWFLKRSLLYCNRMTPLQKVVYQISFLQDIQRSTGSCINAKFRCSGSKVADHVKLQSRAEVHGMDLHGWAAYRYNV